MTSPDSRPEFDVVLRGYHRTQVDEAVGRARAALSGDPSPTPITAGQLRATLFDVVLRGYDRAQVEAYFQQLTDDLAEIESRNTQG
ncbi:DivIVA domain-containing protein [Nocardiopsis sp. EMB25]|uniref:DivIVA domain-containing protein n=1 Tax=Nocardiopsis sp. EMB25 TaxID=2835867 RepID=UPI0022844B8F|nr:DivIVA domain-containing protein [Nocardiopsis sp. EMB25]MCY9786204.1 DivIVA domain-containing protein [Nocardiopsis sp. EMB25]